MLEPGVRVVLEHPRMAPKYLNGTVVELTAQTARGWEGEIVSMLTPRPRGRFYVGAGLRGLRPHIMRVIEKGTAPCSTPPTASPTSSAS